MGILGGVIGLTLYLTKESAWAAPMQHAADTLVDGSFSRGGAAAGDGGDDEEG